MSRSAQAAVSAYIPCHNDAGTVARAIASIRNQTRPVQQLLLVDDGSSDQSVKIAAAAGVELIRHRRNLGRGAARARAMSAARHELVLCCDATKVLQRDFVARALPRFDDPRLAAVVGRLAQEPPRSVAERWRGRHLFKDCPAGTLATWGALVRRSAVLEAGNYDPRRRANEDGELGRRLLARGFKVVPEPSAVTIEIGTNSLGDVLERYWRWNRWNKGRGEDLSWRAYARWVLESVRGMAAEDLRCRDAPSMALSLWSPHYRYWRSRWRRLNRSCRNPGTVRPIPPRTDA